MKKIDSFGLSTLIRMACVIICRAERASTSVLTDSAPVSFSVSHAMYSRYATPRYLKIWNASALVCRTAARPRMAAAKCGIIPSVHPKAATTLARAPRERPVANV